jgi:hypothetical protein
MIVVCPSLAQLRRVVFRRPLEAMDNHLKLEPLVHRACERLDGMGELEDNAPRFKRLLAVPPERGSSESGPFSEQEGSGSISSRARKYECTFMFIVNVARRSFGLIPELSWRKTSVCPLARSRAVKNLIEEHYDEISNAWQEHFGS